jgi:outer membrane protein OmpA-like peptidoglycan-associated protein
MTLQDVLEAHPTQKSTLPASQVSATAPLLAPASQASAENVMLMQGMQSALQEPGSGGPTRLKPPQMAAGLAPALQPASSSVMASSAPQPSTQYQPGQQPKNLDSGDVSPTTPLASNAPPENTEPPKATDIDEAPPPLDQDQSASSTTSSSSSSPSTSSDTASSSSSPAPASETTNFAAAMRGNFAAAARQNPSSSSTSSAPSSSGSGSSSSPPPAQVASASSAGCDPHVETWSKTCAEAGYPESYVGKISGETRTICPGGDLQDVWMENSCTPPPEGAAPVAAAAPSAAGSPTTAPAPEAAPTEAVVASAEPASSSAETSMAPAEQASPQPHGVAPPSEYDEREPAAVPAPVESAAAPSAPAVAPSPVIALASATVNANCGAANGLAASSRPMSELCAAGMPSDVSGDGPWRWDCSGSNGGISVSCAAPVSTAPAASAQPASGAGSVSVPAMTPATSEDGKCGGANGVGMDQAPIADLCANGVPSRVNGGGPWTWACSGSNGGQAAACSAAKKIDGTCGPATSEGGSSMPVKGLCASGFASAVTGAGPWNWTCSGLYGGQAATCSMAPKRDAVCGNATLKGHKEAPSDDLCNVGQASTVVGEGPWSWNCGGENEGASVTCTASVSVSGACGAANGVAVPKAPIEELCISGKPTRVTGGGPWTWNCAGSEGGDTQSCTAPVAKAESETIVACGAAANAPAGQMPATNLCTGGTASAVSGSGPWTWSCSDDSGHSAVCATSAAMAGLCGTAANVATAQSPGENLCASGKAGKVDVQKGNWVWNCAGEENGASVSCSAPRLKVTAAATPVNAPASAMASASASCGAAAGRGSLTTPTKDLCDGGKATIVRGKGPWHWVCIKGQDKAACEAPKQIDGQCGTANGEVLKTAPSHGLCVTGSPTDVSGNGPWLWSCIGTGGGASASCSATAQSQARVEGACGAAANANTSVMPSANLCDSGLPSNVYGTGPWTWTCSGSNGGIASSCSARRVVPAGPAAPGPAVNGLCGAANGVAAVERPSEGLCSAGTLTAVSGEGPWNWNCLGQNGGMTVSCTASLMPPAPVTGACGPISGLPTLTTPQSGLCSAGIASAVNGKGPWTWSCSGTNGGGAVGCVAPLATGGGGGLPSLVMPPVSPPPAPAHEVDLTHDNNEAPAPLAAPSAPVNSVLVTPKLPSGPLPPLQTGSMPPFAPAPQGSNAPMTAASVVSPPLTAPQSAPELPPDNAPLLPPPVRDTIRPTPALTPPTIDASGAPIPGNHFALDGSVSTLPFTHGSENIDPAQVPTLDKLVGVLQQNSGVRVTLTAYAGLDPSSSPRDARRLSLSRALTVRDYLTAKGISSARIDVRALGANVPSGDADRVDVKAN